MPFSQSQPLIPLFLGFHSKHQQKAGTIFQHRLYQMQRFVHLVTRLRGLLLLIRKLRQPSALLRQKCRSLYSASKTSTSLCQKIQAQIARISNRVCCTTLCLKSRGMAPHIQKSPGSAKFSKKNAAQYHDDKWIGSSTSTSTTRLSQA